MRQEATETVEAEISSEVTAEPTCDTEGTRTYTATGIYNGQTYTDTRTEPIAMTGHAWNAPVFTWTEDGEGYSATATFTCGKCGDSRTENAEVTRIRHTEATCTKQEVTVYKAEYDGYSENKTVYGDALGHDWSDWSIVWNDDYTAFATRRCGRCGQTENAEVTVTHEVTQTATCQRKGEITYTASAAPGGQEVTSTKKQYTPKTGHTPGRTETSEDGHFTYTYCDVCGELLSSDFAGHLWSDPVYVWAEDYSSVTATRTCTLTPHLPHSETETVSATGVETKAPTCLLNGETTYTSAEFENAAFTVQTKTVDDIPALGHDWGEPTYEWNADNSKVTATRVCAHDTSHVETETVSTTFEVTKAMTCLVNGETTYTSAEFENTAFTVQTKTVDDITAPGGHDWGEPVYVWAEDYSTVTATRTCTMIPHLPHSESETVEAELVQITKEPTCEEPGLADYVSKPFANEAFTVQTHTDIPVAALGHEWGEPEYEWLYGNTKVRATRKCTRNEEHTDTEEVGVTVVSYKAPTETKAGKAVYTSEAFTMDGCTVQTKTVDIPALNKITSTMNLPSGLTVIETEAEKPFRLVVNTKYLWDPVSLDVPAGKSVFRI